MAKPQKQNRDYTTIIFIVVSFLVSTYICISYIIDYRYLHSFDPETTPSYTGECISADYRSSRSRYGSVHLIYNFLMDNQNAYSISQNDLPNKTITIETLRTLEGQTLTFYHSPLFRAPYIFDFTFPIYRMENNEGDILIDASEYTGYFWMIFFGIYSSSIILYYSLRYINRKRKAAEKARKQAARRASRAAARARQAEKKAQKAAARQISAETPINKT